MPKRSEDITEFIRQWDRIIREDFQWRSSNLDTQWAQGYELCRNSRNGARRGNLISNFVDSLVSRFLMKSWDVQVLAHSPDHATHAKDFETLASMLSEVSNLLTRTQKAAMNATWGVGWSYVGHPLDPYALQVERRLNAPDPTGGLGEATPDEWTPVSEDELRAYGVEPGDVEELSPDVVAGLGDPSQEDPQPLLPSDFGLPWVQVLDPRYVIHSINASDVESCEYIAVLHFLTRKELALVFKEVPDHLPLHSSMRVLWQEVEGKNPALYPELTCIVEVFLRQCRNDPSYSWHRFAYPYSAPDSWLYFVPNNHGKYVPVEPLKLNMISLLWDASVAMQLREFTDKLDMVHQAVGVSIQREMRQKWKVAAGAGLDAENEKKLLSIVHEGVIRLTDPNSLTQLESQFNDGLLRAAIYYRTMAQAQTGQSDMDRGQAIKGITARQTDVLVQASGLNMQAMGVQISNFVAHVLFKQVYLLTRYGPVGKAASLNWGRLALIFDRSTQDIATSLLYKVYIRDTGRNPTVDEQLSFQNSLRALSSPAGQVILQQLNPRFLAREFLASFGLGPEGLLPAQPPGVAGISLGPEGQLQPAFSPGMQEIAGALPPGMVDMGQGQHAERGAGDRGGVGAAQMRSGLRMLGLGTGED